MIGIGQDSKGMGREVVYMQSSEIIEAGINLLLAVRQAPENREYRKEIDDEVRFQRGKLKEIGKNEFK